jgi:hypothetical protein
MEEKASRGQRLYEFGDSAQVINNAANATIFFLDLRGFTKTSEGQISERDLTRELYIVFDAFVPLALVDVRGSVGRRRANPHDPIEQPPPRKRYAHAANAIGPPCSDNHGHTPLPLPLRTRKTRVRMRLSAITPTAPRVDVATSGSN